MEGKRRDVSKAWYRLFDRVGPRLFQLFGRKDDPRCKGLTAKQDAINLSLFKLKAAGGRWSVEQVDRLSDLIMEVLA